MSDRPTLVIAGATGFIGRWFIERFHTQYRIIALSRDVMAPEPDYRLAEWRQVDLYSTSSTERALLGADYALYLIHSMSPSARLHQGTFEDTDILLADNFARAARANGVQQIVFVGGILPREEALEDMSRHLRSRREVEIALGATGIAVTALRAGIIVGAGGSSFQMIDRLVSTLPVMICPAWCQSETQPIELDDALRIIDHCLGNEQTYDRSIDIGGPEVTTYMDMLRTVAELKGKRRLIFPVNFFSPGLSTYWVSLITGNSTNLVVPLVESLRHRMVATDNEVLQHFPDRKNFRTAARRALSGKDQLSPLPHRVPREGEERNTVRSIQRLPNPGQHNAVYVARLYQRWLPRFFGILIGAKTEVDTTTFHFFGLPLLELEFIRDRSDDDRQLFYIVGGLLVKRRDHGWIEFRRVLNGQYILSAIHEFVPALPWYVYILTQAKAHAWVMKRFGKYLSTHRPDGYSRTNAPSAGVTPA